MSTDNNRKDAAQRAIEYLQENNIRINRAKALELIARIASAPNWNQLVGATRQMNALTAPPEAAMTPAVHSGQQQLSFSFLPSTPPVSHLLAKTAALMNKYIPVDSQDYSDLGHLLAEFERTSVWGKWTRSHIEEILQAQRDFQEDAESPKSLPEVSDVEFQMLTYFVDRHDVTESDTAMLEGCYRLSEQLWSNKN